MRSNARTLLLALTSSLLPVGSLLADNFIVAPPFTIQAAVNAALANSDPNDNIFVQPGSYPEQVTVDYTSGVGVSQRSLTILRNTSTKPKVTRGFLIRDSRLVTVAGFRVDSIHDDGLAQIRIQDCVGVAIVDCRGLTGDDSGVHARRTFEVIVRDCVFSGMLSTPGTGIGVDIEDRCGHLLRDTITDNNESFGLWIQADRSLVQKCRSSNNGSGGIYLKGLQNAIKSCDAHNNGGTGVQAVGVCSLKSTVANSNTAGGISYGESGGVQYYGGSIRKCTTNQNGGVGIIVRTDQDGADVASNTARANAGGGIKLAGNRHKVFRNNCKNSTSGGHGILVAGGSVGNCLEENTTKGNDGQGIKINGDSSFLKLNRARGSDGIVEAVGAVGNEGYSNVAGGTNDFP